MADTDGSPADRNRIAFARWDKRMRESLRPLLTKKIISEHKRDPVGMHSDALDRVLNYFRRPNMLERHVIVCTRPFKQWRVARVTGVSGQGPVFADERSFNSEAKAAHAVFLMHVEQTMRD
jgi:branched-chain amino acid transport system permease protein